MPFERPGIVRWGASTRELIGELDNGGLCAGSVRAFTVEAPFLPRLVLGQEQVECDGLPFLGRPRRVEFVVGDDRLQMTWILISKAEVPALLAAMATALGPPTRRNATYAAWPSEGTALRLEPPEVLFYAPELADDMAPDFE